MSDKVISLDNRPGPFQMIFQRIMRMVPDRDRSDPQLRRLLAFRLSLDGEDATRAYLMRTIRDAIQENYTGRYAGRTLRSARARLKPTKPKVENDAHRSAQRHRHTAHRADAKSHGRS